MTRLNRCLNRPLDRFLNHRLDGRSCRRPSYLAQACALLEEYVRLRRKTAQAEPRLFGPHAGAYYRDTVRMEAEQKARSAALDKVFGPNPPGSAGPASVWTERYAIPPENMRVHRKWFRENYAE